MRILEKYVLKSYVCSLIFCISLLMILGIIGDVLGFLDDIFKNNIPLSSILLFYLHLAPFAFVNMIPFACLLSAVFVFNNLSKNHEVTAVIASGLSLWKLLRPVLLVTFIVCLFVMIVNDRLVPQSMGKANVIRNEKLESGGRKEKEIKNIAIYGKGNRIIFAKSYNPDTKTLSNVIIHAQDETRSITVKTSARLVKWRDDNVWEGIDVIIFRIGADKKFSIEPQVFKRKIIPIQEVPDDFTNKQWDPKFMGYAQLKKYIKIFSIGSSSTVRRLMVDLNYKLAFPFTALITVLVGAPFSIETGRASHLIGMVRGILVAMLYLPVMAICLALGKGGVLPPIAAAWMSNILFAAVGAYYVTKKS